MKVIKNPAYLFPDPDIRAHLKRIKKQYNILLDVIEDP